MNVSNFSEFLEIIGVKKKRKSSANIENEAFLKNESNDLFKTIFYIHFNQNNIKTVIDFVSQKEIKIYGNAEFIELSSQNPLSFEDKWGRKIPTIFAIESKNGNLKDCFGTVSSDSNSVLGIEFWFKSTSDAPFILFSTDKNFVSFGFKNNNFFLNSDGKNLFFDKSNKLFQFQNNTWQHIFFQFVSLDKIEVFFNSKIMFFLPTKIHISRFWQEKIISFFPFTGYVTEVRVWSTLLNENDIKEQYLIPLSRIFDEENKIKIKLKTKNSKKKKAIESESLKTLHKKLKLIDSPEQIKPIDKIIENLNEQVKIEPLVINIENSPITRNFKQVSFNFLCSFADLNTNISQNDKIHEVLVNKGSEIFLDEFICQIRHFFSKKDIKSSILFIDHVITSILSIDVKNYLSIVNEIKNYKLLCLVFKNIEENLLKTNPDEKQLNHSFYSVLKLSLHQFDQFIIQIEAFKFFYFSQNKKMIFFLSEKLKNTQTNQLFNVLVKKNSEIFNLIEKTFTLTSKQENSETFSNHCEICQNVNSIKDSVFCSKCDDKLVFSFEVY